ncbi:MAG: polysaccharide biosynthesis tyrosine autokinase [Candidatus Omnitrophica bacterium]|nr:polysaccharide biosynthesis tyrosine autokinase [Candidatus Omnitrophota bacterium]
MDELTLRDYMKVIFRQKWVIILCVITVTLTVFAGLKFQTKRYAARVKLLISAQKQSESQFYHDIVNNQNTQLALTESEIVTSAPVLDRALKAILPYKPLSEFAGYERRFASALKQEWIDRQVKKFNEKLDSLKLSDAQKHAYLYRMAFDGLKKSIKVVPVQDTNIFTITVTDYDPLGAAVIANIVSRSYIIFDLEQQLADMEQKYGEKNLVISQLRDDIRRMTEHLNGQPLDNVDAIGPASVKIIEQAYPPIEPEGQKKIVILILGVLMSLFLGLMLAFIFDYMDQTFRSPDDIERFLGVPFLGSVVRRNMSFPSIPIGNPNRRKLKNLVFFKNVAEQIYLLMKDKSYKTLLFIASRKGEGASTVSRNVAKYIALVMGHRVLIIDANPRHKQLKPKKGTPAVLGLFEILEEKAELAQCIQKTEDKLDCLWAGKATFNPGILLSSHKMTEVLKQVREKYDIVIVDTDSLNVSKDALEISNNVDSVVLVIAEGQPRRHAVKFALEKFKNRKAQVLGAILNKRKFPLPGFLYESV